MTLGDFFLLAAQIAVLILTAAFLGKIAKSLGLPKVAGELTAGILLGPTFLSGHFSALHDFLFPQNERLFHLRSNLVHTGLLFFLLAAGMEIQPDYLKKNAKAVILCSLSGIFFPFVLGWSFAMAFPGLVDSGPQSHKFIALFLGTALSISALPVIAKILIDLKLLKTRFGTLVMSAASLDDLAGWILFSALLSVFQGGVVTGAGILLKIASLFAVAVAAIVFQRPIENFFLRVRPVVSEHFLILPVFLLTILAAKGTELLGLHGVFGSFMTGVLLAGAARVWQSLHSKLLYAVSYFFAPLFFASVGLKINFVLHFDPLLFFAILAIACLGKILGVSAGARASGLSFKESLALAFAMNARGAMGMVLAAAALEYGMIQENLFTALVLMALVTSIMSAPAITALLDSNRSRLRETA